MSRTESPMLSSLRRAVEKSPRDQRLRRIEHQGHSYWVKRPERLTLRLRLQKGNPRRAFERERRAYQTMSRRGLPVASLVIDGPDYLVTRDAGLPLNKIMRNPDTPAADRNAAMTAAAAALHQLHAAGVAHGRPNLKDILWDNEKITFIDLERFEKTRNLRLAKVLDYVIFAFSCFATLNQSLPSIDIALQAYRALDTEGTATAALRLLNSLTWLQKIAGWLGRKTGSREVRALPKLLDWSRTAMLLPPASNPEPETDEPDS